MRAAEWRASRDDTEVLIGIIAELATECCAAGYTEGARPENVHTLLVSGAVEARSLDPVSAVALIGYGRDAVAKVPARKVRVGVAEVVRGTTAILTRDWPRIDVADLVAGIAAGVAAGKSSRTGADPVVAELGFGTVFARAAVPARADAATNCAITIARSVIVTETAELAASAVVTTRGARLSAADRWVVAAEVVTADQSGAAGAGIAGCLRGQA